MDKPIEKRALGVDVRVEQALAAGVYAIDADDARELLAALRHSQHVARGFDYQNMELTTQVLAVKEHAQELETQLFHARANKGGSSELVAAAISIRDRLADYFRYVEEAIPFAKTAEARERGTAIVDGMKWLIQEAESCRLAAQAVKTQRNQLEAELAEARLAMDVSQGQVKQLDAEAAELRDLAARQADLLSRTAVAIRGPEPELTRWSHHDLPERAQQLREQCDSLSGMLNVCRPFG